MRRGLCPSAVVEKQMIAFACCFSQRRHGAVTSNPGGSCASSGKPSAVEVNPLPPRPAFYVPPEERDAGDASLHFLRGNRLKKKTADNNDDNNNNSKVEVCGSAEVRLGPGQRLAPALPTRSSSASASQERHYMDETAAALASTSIHAGHHLLPDEPEVTRSRLSVIKNSAVDLKEVRPRSGVNALRSKHGEFIFNVRDQFEDVGECGKPFAKGEKEAGDVNSGSSQSESRSVLQDMELDLRRLEYYQGSTQYRELLEEFRTKYGCTENSKVGSDCSGKSSNDAKLGGRSHSQEELECGLEAQPIDYLRASNKLKVELSSGPKAYDPVVVMQKLGVMRFQGYAFPPTTELGKLRDKDGKDVELNEESSSALKGYMRQNISSTIKTQLSGTQDKHLLNRALGLDAVQRRQVKAMLSDFDYGDRQTSFHVMMSYPYTDWIHAFYMVFVGWVLYTLQVKFGAYEFYDEYLGLDLRQVPRLKKPCLAMVTVAVMVVALFHPLLLASIATTRFYRIFMRRPIGPP